jgi:hypothetical protein
MALPPDSTAPEAPPDAPPAGPPPRILGDLGYTALAVLWAILIIAAGAWLQSR